MKLLVSNGADVNCTDRSDNTPLMIICSNEYTDENIGNFLIDMGADVNHYNAHYETALILACKHRRISTLKLIKQLVDKTVDINHVTEYGESAFTILCYYGNIGAIKLLIEKGADINYTDDEGYNGAVYACMNQHEYLAKMLIEKGVDINIATLRGYTCLIYACIVGCIYLTKLLIKYGADINYVNNVGDSALTFACINGRTEIIKLLIEKGAVINYKINYNTLFTVAYSKSSSDIIKILTNYGYDYAELSKHSKLDKSVNVYHYTNTNIRVILIPYEDFFKYLANSCLFCNFQNQVDKIINFIKQYVLTDEYKRERNIIYGKKASDMFSQIVCVSDDYYTFK